MAKPLAFLCSAIKETAFSTSGQRSLLADEEKLCRTLESLTASCHDPKDSFPCLCCGVNGARLGPQDWGETSALEHPWGVGLAGTRSCLLSGPLKLGFNRARPGLS